MTTVTSLGYSPCPNDTFIFCALAEGRIAPGPFGRFDVTLADVEELNQRARKGLLDVTKVSIAALPHLLREYRVLRSGGAIGRGCGPLVVAGRRVAIGDLRDARIAIPGELTTANLLLGLTGQHRGERVVMTFDRIMPAVARGDVDAGVIIHEGRFTYPTLGLELVLDLGEWWERTTGLPLPLGAILMRRSLGEEAALDMEAKIRESLALARKDPGAAWPYIERHAQEMAPDVIRSHIDMFVNDYSRDVGPDGEAAIRHIVEAAARVQAIPLPDLPVFTAPRG